MRLLVDEDSEGRSVVRLLRESGHDVLTVTDAGLASHADAEVMQLACAQKRVVLTRNVNDYLALHEADTNHPSILIEYQDRDPRKNMSAASVVLALSNIESAIPNLGRQFIAINAFVY